MHCVSLLALHDLSLTSIYFHFYGALLHGSNFGGGGQEVSFLVILVVFLPLMVLEK